MIGQVFSGIRYLFPREGFAITKVCKISQISAINHRENQHSMLNNIKLFSEQGIGREFKS